MIRFLGSPECRPAYFSVPVSGDAGWLSATQSSQWKDYGPYPFLVPPPDGVWYEFGDDYGVPSSEFDAGFFLKDKTRRKFKDAYHGKVSGTIFPKCVSDSPCPNFLGTMSSHNVYENGGFSPPDRSFYNVGNLFYLHAQSFSDAVVEGFTLAPEDAIHAHAQFPGNEDFWTWPSPWIDPNGFPSPIICGRSMTEVIANNKFRKTNNHELSTLYPPDWGIPAYPPWLLGVPYIEYGTRQVVTTTMHSIRNTGSLVEVEATADWSILTLSSPGSTPVLTTGSDYLTLNLFLGYATFLPPDASSIASRFRWYCDRNISVPIPNDGEVRVRTQALVNIEDLGMNNLENAMGIRGLSSILKTLLDGYKAVKNLNPRAALKFLTDAYLIYKFAVTPTISDVKNVQKLGPKMLKRLQHPDEFITRRRATEVITVFRGDGSEFRMKLSSEFILELDGSLAAKVINALDSIGLLPSAANLWALVPFSFVIDWFLNLEDVFQALRVDRDKEVYTLLGRVESRRFEHGVPHEYEVVILGPGWTTLVPLSATCFKRSVSLAWGEIDPLTLAGGSGLSVSQMISGFALILQKSIR